MLNNEIKIKEDMICVFGSRDLWKFDYFIFVKNKRLSLKKFLLFINASPNSYTETIAIRLYNHFFSRQRKLKNDYKTYYKYWYHNFAFFLEERYLVNPKIASFFAKENTMIVDLNKDGDLGVEGVLPENGCFSLIHDFIKQVDQL